MTQADDVDYDDAHPAAEFPDVPLYQYYKVRNPSHWRRQTGHHARLVLVDLAAVLVAGAAFALYELMACTATFVLLIVACAGVVLWFRRQRIDQAARR